jgi:2-methylcitrate dehydratase PrpD
MTYSEQLAKYIVDITPEKISAEALRKARELFLDTVGVMVFGSDLESSRIVLRHFESMGGAQEAGIIQSNLRLPAANAAFVNGTMAHSFDYDDDWAACHIACCVIPAALAIAQKTHSSVNDFLASIVIGYDVTIRLAQTLDGYNLYAMGFHPTPICGTYGAFAAVSKLLNLSVDEIAHGCGIAASFISGSLEWLEDGSMTKRFHGGKAASEGIMAGLLAKNGFTGPKTIFEGKDGVFKMLRAQRDHRLFTEELGTRFDILKTFMKLYPCCTCNAPIIDAVLELKREHHFSAEDVDHVDVQLRKSCMYLVGEPLDRKQNTENVLEAQMSAPYSVAAAIVDGELFPQQYTIEKVTNSKIKALSRRVTTTWNPEFEINTPPRPIPANVKIKLKSGATVEKTVFYQKGTPSNPFSEEELKAKFLGCTSERLGRDRARETFSKVLSVQDLSELCELIM